MGELLQRIATAAEDRVGDLQLTAKSCMTEGVLPKASGHFVPRKLQQNMRGLAEWPLQKL